ncbi:hypothetical protein GGI42DRAFT_340544 [Trichoderma sp. SZMC 28013]
MPRSRRVNDDDGGIGSRKGREKSCGKTRLYKRKQRRKKGRRRSQPTTRTRESTDGEGEGKGKGKHEKKEKSHQATGRGKTERRKRGGGGEGLETGAKILWAATTSPWSPVAASHRACIGTWIPGPGWRSAGGTGTRPAHSHIGTDERASPLLGPQHLPCVLPRRNPLRDTRMGRRRCERCEPGEAHRTCVCVWLCFGQFMSVLVQGSSSRRPIRGRRRRSICAAPGSPRFQQTSWYLGLRRARH